MMTNDSTTPDGMDNSYEAVMARINERRKRAAQAETPAERQARETRQIAEHEAAERRHADMARRIQTAAPATRPRRRSVANDSPQGQECLADV